MDDARLAPEFPDSLVWLNLAEPLRLARLRGRPCAIAFVNAHSAWSLQQMRELAQLQARHGDRLQVVAIHVPRFDHERDPRRVASALHRNGIDLPVALDADWVAWQHFDIDAWPTVVLVDGEGRIGGRQVGVTPLQALDAALQPLGGPGTSPESGAPVRADRGEEPRLPLRFPTGLAVDAQYLYVADTGHHRVLECDHAGRILRRFGSGDPGFLDGPAGEAAFSRPAGLCLKRGMLYVVDAANHAIRRIDLRGGSVATLCGTGQPGQPVEGPVASPRDLALDHPSAVAMVGDALLIACTGDNRIWRYDLGKDAMSLLAGSGALAVEDGSGAAAAFAEPAGLAAVEQRVYVCDRAGSAIRTVATRSGKVTTLVGGDPWAFGAEDGARSHARLQAPRAIALDPDAPVLWIADTGNDALRSLRLGGGELTTQALPQRLHAPGGLAVADGVVWIADTDAHAVLRLDVAGGALQRVPIGE